MSTHLLAGLGGVDGLHRVDQQVLELERLNKVGVPDQAAVKHLEIRVLEQKHGHEESIGGNG